MSVLRMTQEVLSLLNTGHWSYPRVLVPPVLQLQTNYRIVLKITEETLQLLMKEEVTVLTLSCTMLRVTQAQLPMNE